MTHEASLLQMILAQRYDIYDNANGAEYWGIYGNRDIAPDIGADECAAVPRMVDDGPEAESDRFRALEVNALCRAAEGRRAAVDLTTQQRW